MKLNHVANRLGPRHFETVVEMLKAKLGFVELRRTERSVWLRQPGANVDLQFSSSNTAARDADKLRSQVSFLSEAPRAALADLATWARERGLEASVGSYSEREFYLDAPEAFVDSVIEADAAGARGLRRRGLTGLSRPPAPAPSPPWCASRPRHLAASARRAR